MIRGDWRRRALWAGGGGVRPEGGGGRPYARKPNTDDEKIIKLVSVSVLLALPGRFTHQLPVHGGIPTELLLAASCQIPHSSKLPKLPTLKIATLYLVPPLTQVPGSSHL